MGKLNGKIALIAGGTGGVGEGIVRGFLQEGATVVVPSRSAEKAEQLYQKLDSISPDHLITIAQDIGQPAGAEAIRDEIFNRFGQLDAIVASLGRHWKENLPLVEVPIETWRQYMEDNITSHFIVARTFLPVLAKQSGTSYTFINGNSADLFIPNYSPLGVSSAAQLKMMQTAAGELKGSSVRINAIILGLVQTAARANEAQPDWITPDEVGSFTAWLASHEGRMVSGSVLRLYDRPSTDAKT
jgi:3-oxoacyl-[acyl-carrier protein] reductase